MKKQIGIFINLKKHDALNVLYEFFHEIKSLKFNFAIQESLSKKIKDPI